ncbi:MAG: branched-chain amino acid ABC transporter permease [Clostridiales bacterium]|nr:branched-chain amino acid ABC transporter permease [Clostridiales bacterium]
MKAIFGDLSKKQIVLLVVLLVIALVLPQLTGSMFVHNLLILIVIWSILGMGWNVMGGFTGLVSNGHCMFYGFGAYSVGLTLQYFGWSPLITIFLGMIFSAAVAFVIGKPVLRLKGHAFAICTMALAECMRYVCVNVAFTNGAKGVSMFKKGVNPVLFLQFKDERIYYYLYLAILLIVLALIKYLSKSKFFYYLRTIRGNEEAAASVGIDVSKYKIRAYMLSAAIVSLGGSLYAQYLLYFDPASMMTLNVSMMIVLVSVMGGIGTVTGPILGAIVIESLSEYTRSFLGTYGGLDMVLYGVLVIIIVLFLPGGLLSLPTKIKEAMERNKASGKGEHV